MSDPEPLLPFLSSLPAFSLWADDESLGPALSDLSARGEIWSFEDGDIVRFPDEAASGPTWVMDGCLVELKEGLPPRYVGVRETLSDESGPWVRGKTAGHFATVSEGSWREWLNAFPGAATRLGIDPPPSLPRSLLRSPLVLEPGEFPLHLFRKSRLFLLQRVLLPTLFFLAFLSFGVLLSLGFGDRVPALALWFLPGLGMLITAGLAALVGWEWSTSVLAITDRSIIVRQMDVWAHRSDFEKLALERVREAVFTKSGLVDALLGLVTLEVEGDSPKGRLHFRGLANNSRFLTAMENMRLQRKAQTPARRLIRRALADRSGGSRVPLLRVPSRRPDPLTPRTRRLSWRVEEKGMVWFRRHPWAVAKRSLPWAGWMALVAFVAAFAAGLWPEGMLTVSLVGLVTGLIPASGIVWEIWDWADDRLSIQGDKIVMVHRRPLWLGEIRQEGNLERVEQVGVRKETLSALVLDYGMVSISLGASEPLNFEHASHPEWVQNEIFHRRTLLAQDRERRAAEARLNEVSEILDTWEEAKKAGYFYEQEDRA